MQLKSSRSQSPIGICVIENLLKFERNEEDYQMMCDQMFQEHKIGTVKQSYMLRINTTLKNFCQ